MGNHILLPNFILARVLGRFRQQIGSVIDPKRIGARAGSRTRANGMQVRATCMGAQSGHFEGTSANLDQKLTEKNICC